MPLYVAFYDLPFASRLNGVPARQVPNVVRVSYVSALRGLQTLDAGEFAGVFHTGQYRLLVSNVFDLAWNTVNSDM